MLTGSAMFFVVFQVNNHSAVSGSQHQSLSSTLPHPFYLSFESEHMEECFEMPHLIWSGVWLMEKIIFGQSISFGTTAIL
jgi:hypothetical protein